ncbi:MAG: NADH-quinone oxidoreductase subunit C [Rhodothermales bacterium]|nr:NADH-quinone oxidoreductase subunit C [Rhodothermales bacterium]
MRDDARNTETKTNERLTHETLKFHFTPVEPPTPEEAAANPHAQPTTHVPEAVEALRDRFGEAVGAVVTYAGEDTVFVEPAQIRDVCRFLKDEQGFTYLVDIGGVDRFTEEDRFEVFYNLINLEGRKRLRIKVRVDEEALRVPSIVPVFRSADWNEREVYDMLGIVFDGHPDLRRMYMPEDFEYFPQRKEFPLLGIPGSLPLPPQTPEGDLTMDPFAAAHGAKPVKSYEEPATAPDDEED